MVCLLMQAGGRGWLSKRTLVKPPLLATANVRSGRLPVEGANSISTKSATGQVVQSCVQIRRRSRAP
jgi:hypothetical protein